MQRRSLITFVLSLVLVATSSLGAQADSASPAQSMTHMKTAPAISSQLESLGVVLYAQGGATAGVMGESISDAKGQVVFHIPITANKNGVQHAGSNIVLFNTLNNRQLQLRNPVIDLKKGTVSAIIPQLDEKPTTVLTISNLNGLKAKVSTDRSVGVRSRTFAGANLNFAPGVAAVVSSAIGLAEGSLPEGALFASADVTLKKSLR